MTNVVFSSQKLLSETLFPFLTGEELANISSVNKASEKAAKVELLWEILCTKSENSEIYCRHKTWKLNYQLVFNWNHGLYHETTVDLDAKNIHIDDIYDQHFLTPYTATPNEEGIKIFLLDANKELFLKAPGFLNRKQFLKNILFSKTHAIIKTDLGIEIYLRENGEHLRTFLITNPNSNRCFDCYENYLASIDEGGAVFKLWNITTGELLWEDRFSNFPQNQRNTIFFHFTDKKTIKWFWIYTLSEVGTWQFDIEKRSIAESKLIGDPVETTSANRKQNHRDRVQKFSDHLASNFKADTSAQIFNSLVSTYPNTYTSQQIIKAVSACFNIRITSDKYFSSENNKIGFSLIRGWNLFTDQTTFLKKIENLWIRKVFTGDWTKLYLAVQPMTTPHKTILLTYDFDPQNKPQKHPEHIDMSKLIPNTNPANPVISYSEAQIPPREHIIIAPPKTLWQRIVYVATKVFMFLTYPFRKVGELSINILKDVVRIIRSSIERLQV